MGISGGINVDLPIEAPVIFNNTSLGFVWVLDIVLCSSLEIKDNINQAYPSGYTF